MPTRFSLGLTLRGANGRTRPLTLDMGIFTGVDAGAEYLEAVTAAGQITGALDAVTDAIIAERRIQSVELLSTAVPAAADLFENAMVNVHSLDENDPDALAHIAQIYIPAPVIGVFQTATGPGRDIVDVNDADLTQYVQQLEQHALISDGETIQVSLGVGGMVDGRRVVRKVRLGR